MNTEQPSSGEAFMKGGCGCLLALLGLSACVLLAGGSVQIDLGGLLCLFVLGGGLGLIVLMIYNKGRNDAGR